jgi:hypothetical protein
MGLATLDNLSPGTRGYWATRLQKNAGTGRLLSGEISFARSDDLLLSPERGELQPSSEIRNWLFVYPLNSILHLGIR